MSRPGAVHSLSDGAVGRALRSIDAQYMDPNLTLSMISETVSLTRWHLARRIRAATGSTFLRHLHSRRVA